MRITKRNAVRATLVIGVAVAIVFFVFGQSGNRPLEAAAPAPKPAVAKESPLNSASQPAATISASPALAEADNEALLYLDHYWEVFVTALEQTDGTKLSAAQLEKPRVAIAKDLSGCPPGAENKLPKTVKAALGFCHGEIRVIPAAFNKLTDTDQQLATANAFIYHAFAKTTAEQRKYSSGKSRNDAQVLGCLQASLSYAFERFGGGTADAVWVVMSNSLDGGSVFNTYNTTYDFNGEWM